jgi:RNA polymerase sigma-70 factor (ECF subfamily)
MEPMEVGYLALRSPETDIEDQGFRESFEAFYARELRALVGLAYVLSGSRSGAEDLAQDGLLAAYRHWDRIAGYDDPGAWVRRVVANHAVSGFRRSRAEARALIRIRPLEQVVPEIPVDSERVWQEVRRLPARQRQVIALRYLDRRPIAEIARILECSENTVKTHLQRGKRALAQSLDLPEEGTQ